jgi:septal ring factor EnvC (AmiA/AmiB activator)
MSLFRRRSNATSAPVANGNRKFNQAQLNTATTQLQNALKKIANQHVLKYANDIRANAKARANAARANAVAAVAPTPANNNNAEKANERAAAAHQNMIESENAAKNSVTAAPVSGPVNHNVQNAEVEAISSVGMLIRNIANYQTIGNLNKVKSSTRYQNASVNNKVRINKAVNAKRASLESIL